MPAAARIGDDHLCPMSDGPKPHKGGPILPSGCVTVLIGGQPAARAGDNAACAGPPDAIAQGSPSVLIGYQDAARVGDATEHGGQVTQGEGTVLIGTDGDGAPWTVPFGSGAAKAASETAGAVGQSGAKQASKASRRPAPPQAAALRAAAAQGKPFCEVCERRRRRRRAAEHERERG